MASARTTPTRAGTRVRVLVFAVSAMVAVAACGAPRPVAVEESRRSPAGPIVPDGQASLPPIESESPPDFGASDLPVVEAPVSTIAWGSCADFGAPEVDWLGTALWECARLSVPMDPFGDDPTAGEVELALTRHPATGDRRGAILLNPGGPGGAGLPTAWNVRSGMPADVLRAFDIVSWDPRGVGASTPKIDCDDAVGTGDTDFIARCAELTGPLSAFLSAPYSAADMEAIRVALGEAELNYLGYSYGSILGATYAAAHPERVGSFVLDGVTDPAAGSADGPSEDGFAVLADDGTERARDRLVEICDATDRCLFSLDAATVVDDLAFQVPVLPTSDFDGGPEQIDTASFEELLDTAVTYAGDWELLATALEVRVDGSGIRVRHEQARWLDSLARIRIRRVSLHPDGQVEFDGGASGMMDWAVRSGLERASSRISELVKDSPRFERLRTFLRFDPPDVEAPAPEP